MVKDKQFKIEEENIKENGFSIINFLLIVIVIIASYFAYDMLSKNVDTKITGLTGIEWGCSDLIKFTDSDIIPVLDYEDNCEFVRFKWICPKCGNINDIYTKNIPKCLQDEILRKYAYIIKDTKVIAEDKLLLRVLSALRVKVDREIGFETDKIKLIKSLDMDNNHLYFDSLETDKMIIK